MKIKIIQKGGDKSKSSNEKSFITVTLVKYYKKN